MQGKYEKAIEMFDKAKMIMKHAFFVKLVD